MSGGDDGAGSWLHLPRCFRLSPDLPGDTPLSALGAGATAAPQLDASLEAARAQQVEQLHAQDMDRAGDGGDGGDGRGGPAEAVEHCSLVSGIRQAWDSRIACVSGSSEEDAGIREPLNIERLVAREEAEMAASLSRHAASPRPATGPHGMDAVSGGKHELQLASEAKEMATEDRRLKNDARDANATGGTAGAELAVDLTLACTDGDAVERKRRAIGRAVAGSRGRSVGGGGGGGDPTPPTNYDRRFVQLVHNSPEEWTKLRGERAQERQQQRDASTLSAIVAGLDTDISNAW